MEATRLIENSKPYIAIDIFSHCLSVAWGCRDFPSISTGCLESLRGDWAIFCHAGSGRVGGVWSARKKSIETLRHDREQNPGHREDREIHLFSHWPIMTRATERTDSEMHSFSHWAIMERTDSEIHSPSHWANMERTDSEIHSFSHWAIMERTDSEIHSFSHWAIIERTDSEIHSFYRWAIMTRPQRGQTARYIHSPTELSWPGHREGRQWDTFILPLSYHGEDRQWDTFILPLSYHDPDPGEEIERDTFASSPRHPPQSGFSIGTKI